MSGPRIGSLFAGYGGLDMAVQQVYGGELAWYADCCKFDKDGNAGHHEPHRAPCSIMAHHHPDVPNLGDVTKVKWVPTCGAYEFDGCGRPAEVLPDRSGWQCRYCQKLWPISLGKVYWPEVPEPVDILTGGSPCQDLSHAGRRAGMTEGTRSNLWVAMREAIAQLRPARVIWENVRGAYSACADSDLGRCPRCMGVPGATGHAPHLRALGRVLGDLSDLGYDARWHGLRVSDIGGCHPRFRVFVDAADTQGNTGRLSHGDGGVAAHAQAIRWRPRQLASGDAATQSVTGGDLLPTPRATDGTKGGPNQRGSSGDLMLPSAVALLPTPTSMDSKASGGGYNGQTNGRGGMLLPTPRVTQAGYADDGRGGKSLDVEARSDRWGDYAAAIARWEHILGRPAPEPTQTSSKGNPQLSPAFVEWMMGLPAGWVTDVPGITRNEALKALGNGVVPQQAAEALRVMASWTAVAA